MCMPPNEQWMVPTYMLPNAGKKPISCSHPSYIFQCYVHVYFELDRFGYSLDTQSYWYATDILTIMSWPKCKSGYSHNYYFDWIFNTSQITIGVTKGMGYRDQGAWTCTLACAWLSRESELCGRCEKGGGAPCRATGCGGTPDHLGELCSCLLHQTC